MRRFLPVMVLIVLAPLVAEALPVFAKAMTDGVVIVVLTLAMIGLLALFAIRVRSRVASPAEVTLKLVSPGSVR